MCGICGIFYRDIEKSVENSVLRKMADTIIHRGPDEEGYYIQDNVGLAIRRLKIIDLDTGSQPITDVNNRYTIVLNGEIYNYQELRKELVNVGYTFKTKSDTEVILYAYIHWGKTCLLKFNGMFAIAIFDRKNRSLFLARDRMGIKPLFYTQTKDFFLFGSEIKCILQHPGIERNIDRKGLYSHFMMNYIPGNYTLFQNINSIPPGYYCQVTTTSLSMVQYWKIIPTCDRTINFISAKQQFMELFQDSVRLRLRSDVPLGVFLSGGVDSSSITAVASRLNSTPIHSFSVGFEEKSFDESRYSRLVSKHLGTEHHHMIVKPDILDIIPKLINHLEEPTADSSAIPVYYLSEFTRQFVTVALSGDGADELAGGYETYTADYLARMLRWIPRPIINTFANMGKFIPISFDKYSFSMKLNRFFRGIQKDPFYTHFLWRAIWYPDEMPFLLPDEPYSIEQQLLNEYHSHFEKYQTADLLSKALYTDSTYYLPSDMLIKIDRMSMANSLEVRVPFLDHRLVEFFFRIPSKFKLNHLKNKKYLIKQAMVSHLPQEILKRPKAGFNTPISLWFLNELKPLMSDLLSSTKTKSIPFVNWQYVQKAWNEHQKKIADNGYKLWSVLIFILWYRRFIEGKHVSV
ncbi:MAG: asparagine synthase (glutamine-hydrolyzing) [Candidatus Neomarinimicrobiota bacterium]|nr:MAG: asparagine synthase (glutamine-hydrolyzing) [Candidatus Neomarinimicrobiota bacterium]